MTKKTIFIAIILIAVVGIGFGVWYFFFRSQATNIEKITSNPTVYRGKEVTIEGEVTDRTAFFGTLKFYKVKDKSGEIIVVTRKSPPDIKSDISVKGIIDESFSLGDQKLLVFTEESTAERTRKADKK